MFLDKLLEDFKKADAVDEKVMALLVKVQTLPETKEDLLNLITFCSVNPLIESIPDISVDAVHNQLKIAKQVLVASDNFFYI